MNEYLIAEAGRVTPLGFWSEDYSLTKDDLLIVKDGDGVEELLEYALNRLPYLKDRLEFNSMFLHFGGMPRFEAVSSPDGPGLNMSFVRRREETKPGIDPGIKYEVESSTDFNEWTPVEIAPSRAQK